MIEPLSTIAAFSFTSEIAIPFAVGVIGNLAADKIPAVQSKVTNAIKNISSQGELPQNHHLERAIARAGLIASQACLKQIVEEGSSQFLDDSAHEAKIDGKVFERYLSQVEVNRTQTCLISAQNIIARLIIDLNPVEGDRDHRQLKIFERALDQSKLYSENSAQSNLVISEAPLMDRLGVSSLRSIFSSFATKKRKKEKIIKSLYELRERWAPDLPNFVISNILLYGGWSEGRRLKIKTELTKRLFGENEVWVTAFSLAYIDELRNDKNLYRMAVMLRLENLETQIESSRQEIVAHIDSSYQKAVELFRKSAESIARIESYNSQIMSEFSVLINQLKKEAQINSNQVFFSFRASSEQDSDAEIRPFYFAEEEDVFMGREEILDALHNGFLSLATQSAKFKWLAICGGAGVGKSRLAHHILKKYADTWRFSGFVQRSFVRHAELKLDSLDNLGGPTLFVIDYAGIMPKASCHFIERLASLSVSSPYPVRLILLVRRSTDRFFDFVNQEADGGAALGTQYRPEIHRAENNTLLLPALTQENTLALMRNRIERMNVGECSNTAAEVLIEDNDLLGFLRHYDRHQRPLFAILVADALGKGWVDFTTKTLNYEDSRLKLFQDYIKLQFQRRWTLVFGNDGDLSASDQDRLDKHITFLALSTMCRGIGNEKWKELVENSSRSLTARQVLPHHPTVSMENYGHANDLLDENQILLGLSGARRELNSDDYPILEPDLIGEAFVLMLLGERSAEISCLSGTPDRWREHLIDLAWEVDPDSVAFFAAMLSQDFPRQLAQQRWLLPGELTSRSEGASVNLFSAAANAITDVFRTRPATLEDVEIISNLIDTFSIEPEVSVESKREWADTVSRLAEHLSFIINKSTSPRNRKSKIALVDPRGVRRIDEFESAAQNATTGDTSYQSTAQSDKATVLRAIAVLRSLYDQALHKIFDEEDSVVNRSRRNIVKWTCNSVFWKYRAQRSKNGYAYTALSDEEVKERNRLADFCRDAVENSELTARQLEAICDLTQIIIYAEHGENQSRGKAVFKVIVEKLDSGDLLTYTYPQLFGLINFLGNHAYNEIEYARSIEGDSSDIRHILELTEQLTSIAFERFDPEKENANRRENILNPFCEVSARVIRYRIENKSLEPEVLERNFSFFRYAAESIPPRKVSKSVVEYMSFVLWALDELKLSKTEEVSIYLKLVQRVGFDRETLNDLGFNNLQFHLVQLSEVEAATSIDAISIVEKLVEQIGERGYRDLKEVFLNKIPDPNVPELMVNAFHKKLLTAPMTLLDGEARNKFEYAMFSQQIFQHDVAKIADKLLRKWSVESSAEALSSRTDIFIKLELMIWRSGIHTEWYEVWRKQLILLSSLSGDGIGHIAESIRDDHDKAYIDLCAVVAQLEISAGNSPHDWFAILEADL